MSDPLREGFIFSFYHIMWIERVPPGLYVLILVAHNEVGSLVAIRSKKVDQNGEALFWGLFFNPPRYRIKQRKKPLVDSDDDDDLPPLDEPWAPPPLPPLDACNEWISLRVYALREALYDRIDLLVACWLALIASSRARVGSTCKCFAICARGAWH